MLNSAVLNRMSPKNASLVSAALFAFAGAFAAIIFRPAGGIMLSHDSLAYLHAAETFVSGGGFEYFGYGTPMIQWPLFMPALLGIVSLFTDNVPGIMTWINFFLLAGALLFANLAARERIEKTLFRVLAQIVISFSFSIAQNYYYLWSECAFLFFLALLLWLFLKYLKSNSLPLLIALGITGGLLMWTRYTGMEFAGLIGVFILFCGEKKVFLRRLKNAIIYGGVAGLPFLALLIRNFAASGSFTGRSELPITTLSENLKDTALCISQWFFPSADSAAQIVVVLLILLVFAAVCLIFMLRGSKGAFDAPFWFLTSHCTVYPVLIIYSNTRFALHPIDYRIMAPMFFTAIIWLFYIAEQAARAGKTADGGRATAISGAVLAICALGLNLSAVSQQRPRLTSSLTESNFSEDEMVRYVSGLDENNVKIYTNMPAELFFMTGMDINYPPRHDALEIYLWDACMERLEDSGKDLYVVWYDIETDRNLYQLGELLELLDLELAAEFGNGSIYYLEARCKINVGEKVVVTRVAIRRQKFLTRTHNKRILICTKKSRHGLPWRRLYSR